MRGVRGAVWDGAQDTLRCTRYGARGTTQEGAVHARCKGRGAYHGLSAYCLLLTTYHLLLTTYQVSPEDRAMLLGGREATPWRLLLGADYSEVTSYIYCVRYDAPHTFT